MQTQRCESAVQPIGEMERGARQLTWGPRIWLAVGVTLPSSWPVFLTWKSFALVLITFCVAVSQYLEEGGLGPHRAVLGTPLVGSVPDETWVGQGQGQHPPGYALTGPQQSRVAFSVLVWPL